MKNFVVRAIYCLLLASPLSAAESETVDHVKDNQWERWKCTVEADFNCACGYRGYLKRNGYGMSYEEAFLYQTENVYRHNKGSNFFI